MGSTTDDVLNDLFDLAPRTRVLLGTLSIAGGLLLTWALWEAGWLWSFSLLLGGIGVALLFSGLGDLHREQAVREEWRRAQARKDEIVGTLVDLKRRGRRPSTWLQKQGFKEARVRRYLLDEMRKRLEA